MKCTCDDKTNVRYRHWVTVQTFSGTADASGHVDKSLDSNWSASGRIKANFITKGSREGRIFDQIEGEVDHVLECPSNAFTRAITPSARISYNSKVYNITAAYDVNEERKRVQLHLVEVV